MEEDLLQGPEDDQPGREVIIIFAVFFEAGLAPLSLVLGWLLGHPPLEHFAWSLRDALWGVLAAIPLILMFLAMLRWPIGPLGRGQEVLRQRSRAAVGEKHLVGDRPDLPVGRCRRGDVVPGRGASLAQQLARFSLGAGAGERALRPAASDFGHLHGHRGISWPLSGRGLDL